MAQALSSSFDEWIRPLLNDLQSNDVDMSDFVQYLTGIVTSDSETDEEKQTAIAELLADLDLKHDHPIDDLSRQILDHWYTLQNDPNHHSDTSKSRVDNERAEADDAINTALINAMNQMQSSVKQHRPNKDNDEAAALKKNKSHVLAKYAEVSDEELDYSNEAAASDNAVFHNNNAQEIEDREKKGREMQQEAHKKQQEKNKVDATNQKQKDEDRKKKAQQRAQKQERRR